MSATQRIILDLHIRVDAARLPALVEFLHKAIPHYEAPGGIRVSLVQDEEYPSSFLERVEYADRATYDRDQVRVREEPRMKALLNEWRSLLDSAPVVRVYREIALGSRVLGAVDAAPSDSA